MYSNYYGNYYKPFLVRMYITNGKASSSSHTLLLFEFFCIYINLLLSNAVYLFTISFSCPQTESHWRGCRIFHDIVGPKRLILGLNTLKLKGLSV